jgi:hypothetical protein
VGRNKAVKAKITKGDEKIHPQIFFIKGHILSGQNFNLKEYS